MKLKILSMLVIVSLLLGMAIVSPVKAAGYGTAFVTSITYMNVGTAEATISINFYKESSSTVEANYPVAKLAVNTAASLGIGSVFPSSFSGSAIMMSDQPLVATMVQVPSGSTTVKNRPMSNGFSAGSTSVLIPTVLKNAFGSKTYTIFSVQNAGSAAADVSVHFIPATAGNDVTYTITALPAGAAKYFDMGIFNGVNVGTTFNGSVRITSAQPMVASSIELTSVGDAVYSFEGTSGGGTTLYMPSAQCNFGPSYNKATSFFAIQNASSNAATFVDVNFKGTANGSPVDVTVSLGGLAAGGKISAAGCAAGVPNNFLGSAKITSDQQIVAIAKIAGAGAFVAAHSGVPSGASKLAAPYVRYSDLLYSYTKATPVQQSNIAVQNVGPSTILANTIKVTFVNTDGTTKVYTYPNDLASGAKFSVNPKSGVNLSEFGYLADANGKPIKYGGGVIIEGPGGSQLAGVIRITTNTAAGDVAEDYNAIPVQ